MTDCKCTLCAYFENSDAQIPVKDSARKKFKAWAQNGGKCFYCEEDVASWVEGVLEHIIPRSKGGTDVVFACQKCDKAKGNWDAVQLQEEIDRLIRIRDKVLEYRLEHGFRGEETVS